MLNLLFLFNIDMILLLIKQSLNNFILNLQIGLVNTVYTIFFLYFDKNIFIKVQRDIFFAIFSENTAGEEGHTDGQKDGARRQGHE